VTCSVTAARRAASAAALLVALAVASGAHAQAPAGAPAPAPVTKGGGPVDELLLRPTRLTDQARREYAAGDHPHALSTFERAARARPLDPRTRFNLADGLYKNGKFDESAALYQSLGEDPRAALAGAARFNLGNARYQQQDYRGAIQAYRDALHLKPDDLDTRRNLELALRALQEQQQQQKQQQQNQNQNQNRDQKQQQKSQGQGQQKPGQGQQNPQQQQQSKTPEERENERFREQAGMPKDRAMQLLDALQQNEKAEQKKLLMEKRAAKRGGKDW